MRIYRKVSNFIAYSCSFGIIKSHKSFYSLIKKFIDGNENKKIVEMEDLEAFDIQSEDINAFEDENVLKQVIDEKFLSEILAGNDSLSLRLSSEDKLYYLRESNQILRYIEGETLPDSSCELITLRLLNTYLSTLKNLAEFASELSIIDPANKYIKNSVLHIKRFWEKYTEKREKFLFNKDPTKFEFRKDFCNWNSHINTDISFDLNILNKFNFSEHGTVFENFLKLYHESSNEISNHKEEYLDLVEETLKIDEEMSLIMDIYQHNDIKISQDVIKDNVLFDFEIEKAFERLKYMAQGQDITNEDIETLESKKKELLKQMQRNNEELDEKNRKITKLEKKCISSKQKLQSKKKDVIQALDPNNKKKKKSSSNSDE